MDTKTAAALATFVAAAQNVVDTHYAKSFPTLTAPKLVVDMGRRYAKIVRTEATANSRSVYCFVDITNGDVLKADGWKKPAKHARGSIFSDKHGAEGVGAYGAHYLA